MTLSAEDMLAGSALVRDVVLPAEFATVPASSVRLRPLTVRDLQRITKAAKDDEALSAPFMIQQAMVEPALGYDQVLALPAGLARFLIERINEISGIDTRATRCRRWSRRRWRRRASFWRGNLAGPPRRSAA